MRKGAYFINTARGPMVDYDALTEALKSGHLRGAALETFAVEPTPADLELLRLENVTSDAAYCRRFDQDGQTRGGGCRRGGAPISRGRGSAQSVLTREASSAVTEHGDFDLIIVGGGVNGAGIARDAAGRGLSTLLVEKDDLAQGTSSRSGKLVHGGLRYLEYYEFRLVREALIEREVLLRAAPHIIWPMRFVLPHSPGQRPAWLVRTGLFLYDHLGGRKLLPPTRVLDLKRRPKASR